MQRMQHGDRFIPASLLNAHSAAAQAALEAVLPDGAVGEAGQAVMPAAGLGLETVLAKVTAKDTSTPPRYSWERIIEQADGATSTHPDGTAAGGTPSYYPAVEDNGQNVPLGTV